MQIFSIKALFHSCSLLSIPSCTTLCSHSARLKN